MTAAILATVVLHQSIGVAGWIGIAVVLIALVITASGRDDVVESSTELTLLCTSGSPEQA